MKAAWECVCYLYRLFCCNIMMSVSIQLCEFYQLRHFEYRVYLMTAISIFIYLCPRDITEERSAKLTSLLYFEFSWKLFSTNFNKIVFWSNFYQISDITRVTISRPGLLRVEFSRGTQIRKTTNKPRQTTNFNTMVKTFTKAYIIHNHLLW